MAISVAPLTTTVMGAVAQRHAGVASGINNAVSRTAALLSIAVLSVLVSVTFNNRLDQLLPAVELPADAREQFERERPKLAGAALPADLNESTRLQLQRAIHESFVSAFRLTVLLAALLALASSLSALLMIEGSAQREVTTNTPGAPRLAPEVDGS